MRKRTKKLKETSTDAETGSYITCPITHLLPPTRHRSDADPIEHTGDSTCGEW